MRVLFVTGTMRSWVRKLGTEEEEVVVDVLVLRAAAFWVITAARLPPAEEPPIAILERLRDRRVEPSLWVQRTASQESWTAAGKGFSGASLFWLRVSFGGWNEYMGI